MSIKAEDVKKLRESTGAGMMECKQALTDAKGNFEEAVRILREKGLAKAAKKMDRAATEGVVISYIHAGGKVGSMVEVNCETDFVARTDKFQEFARDIAMHITAANPLYLVPEQIPAEVIEKEKAIFEAQVKESGKPANVIPKIVEGKISKYYDEICLLRQKFIKDDKVSIDELVRAKISELGENIRINRFARFHIGQ